MAMKVGPYGPPGNIGVEFDHGILDGVTKVKLQINNTNQVIYLEVEYAKAKGRERMLLGKSTSSFRVDTFHVDWPREYINSVQGSYGRYDDIGGRITSLTFKTSHDKTSPTYGKCGTADKRFTIMGKGGSRLLGFHGRFGPVLRSLGGYVIAGLPQQVELSGGDEGSAWDDGPYDGITRVLIGHDADGLRYLEFDYFKGNNNEGKATHTHGCDQTREHIEFSLDYPHEHIVKVEGTYDCGFVTSLTFKTSKGKTSPLAGKRVGTEFVLEDNGFRLVGFRGRSGDFINAVGAHFSRIPAPSQKQAAKGGNGGEVWDDGVFDNVRKIYLGHGDAGLNFLKFEYDRDKKLVPGDYHGKALLDEFELAPDEFITSVEGSYKKVDGVDTDVVTMLRFKTNKRMSQPFGINWGTKFVLGEKDHKIVGFHGTAGDFVHQLGVHISPISNNKP